MPDHESPQSLRPLSNVATSSTTALLTDIWRRVLRRPSIGPNDSFFDLGGSSLLAVQLFSEIARALGRQIPPVIIYQLPTIAAQAAFIDQPSRAELSPLVRLRSGRSETNIFIAPGLGGGPAEFFPLSKHLRVPASMYALQPKGMDGLDKPAARIEDMADFYAASIIQQQPRGPYVLIGYSLGGLVALEIARKFSANGEKISLLVMIDSYPDIRFLSPGQSVRLLVQKAKRRMAKFNPGGKSSGAPRLQDIGSFAPGFEQVRQSAYGALRSYKPSFYAGSVKFIRAEKVTEFPADPVAVWSHLVERIEVETVPGNHLSMLSEHYVDLAAALNHYLDG